MCLSLSPLTRPTHGFWKSSKNPEVLVWTSFLTQALVWRILYFCTSYRICAYYTGLLLWDPSVLLHWDYHCLQYWSILNAACYNYTAALKTDCGWLCLFMVELLLHMLLGCIFVYVGAPTPYCLGHCGSNCTSTGSEIGQCVGQEQCTRLVAFFQRRTRILNSLRNVFFT